MEPEPTPRAARTRAALAALLALATFALYARVAGHQLLHFDDDRYLTANPVVAAGLTADGVRWATDLGPDDYNLPGYFDTKKGTASPRWKYYRLNNRSHNTLTPGDALHFPEFVPVSRGRDAAPSSRGRPAKAYLRMPSRAMMRW